jgi:hypothetical protein
MENNITYSGKVIKFRNKHYTLRPEESLRGCQGCVFLNHFDCPKSLTQHCCKGFIFKKSTF